MKKSFTKKHDQGFTLIELLVVISIIGILATVVLGSLNQARMKAQYAKARGDIRQLSTLAMVAKTQTNGTLIEITGTICSEQSCRNRGNITNLPQNDVCWTDYLSAVTSLNAAADGAYFINAPTDPWGSPYLINQNEGEPGFPGGTCYPDYIASAGPNGEYHDTDDVLYNIPETNCSPIVGVHVANINWN